jgi:hypothetical protein
VTQSGFLMLLVFALVLWQLLAKVIHRIIHTHLERGCASSPPDLGIWNFPYRCYLDWVLVTVPVQNAHTGWPLVLDRSNGSAMCSERVDGIPGVNPCSWCNQFFCMGGAMRATDCGSIFASTRALLARAGVLFHTARAASSGSSQCESIFCALSAHFDTGKWRSCRSGKYGVNGKSP